MDTSKNGAYCILAADWVEAAANPLLPTNGVLCRCMDLDGDGILSLYELEYFYEEQLQRMEQLGIETLPFDDCICQVSIRSQRESVLRLVKLFTRP